MIGLASHFAHGLINTLTNMRPLVVFTLGYYLYMFAQFNLVIKYKKEDILILIYFGISTI